MAALTVADSFLLSVDHSLSYDLNSFLGCVVCHECLPLLCVMRPYDFLLVPPFYLSHSLPLLSPQKNSIFALE